VSNFINSDIANISRFQLSFYRNMTIHLFILEALICAGIYTRVKSGGDPSHQAMPYAELRNEITFLSQLFRGEFIFPPEGLDHNMRVALERLEEDNVISITRHAGVEDLYAPEAIELVELSVTERERGRENFDFYCFLIWPFIEASWLGAVSLMMLAPPIGYSAPTTASGVVLPPGEELWLDAKQTHVTAQLLGKTLYHQGDLSYLEAVNKETLQNCYRRFEEDGMIVARRPKDKDNKAAGGVMLKLADDWMPSRDLVTGKLVPSGRLWDFCEAISHSRLEGKNRRDSHTVQMRVISLVDKVSALHWADKARQVQLAASGGTEVEIGRKRKRRSEIGTVAKL
jgi:Glycerol-3-phosphate acyltransferase C-terminal region